MKLIHYILIQPLTMNRDIILDYINGSTEEYESVEMAPFNGVYVNEDRQPFSTLNTTLFYNAIIDGVQAEINGDSEAYSKAAYIFLQSIPITPPSKTNSLGSNQLKLFKNSSGVFQVPHAYALWVGSLYNHQKNKQKEKDTYNFKYNLFEAGELTIDGYRQSDIPMAGELNTNGVVESVFLNDKNLVPSSLKKRNELPCVGFGLYNNLFNKHRYMVMNEGLLPLNNGRPKNVIRNNVDIDKLNVFKIDGKSEIFSAFEVTKNDGYDLYESLYTVFDLQVPQSIYMGLKTYMEHMFWTTSITGATTSAVDKQIREDFKNELYGPIGNLKQVGGKIEFITYLIELGIAGEGSDSANTTFEYQAEVITNAIHSVARNNMTYSESMDSDTINILLYPSGGGVRRPDVSKIKFNKTYKSKDGFYYPSTTNKAGELLTSFVGFWTAVTVNEINSGKKIINDLSDRTLVEKVVMASMPSLLAAEYAYDVTNEVMSYYEDKNNEIESTSSTAKYIDDIISKSDINTREFTKWFNSEDSFLYNSEVFSEPIEYTYKPSVYTIESCIASTANYLWYSGPTFGENSIDNLREPFTKKILQSVSDLGLEITSNLSGNFDVAEFLSMFDEKTLEVFENEFLDFVNPKQTTNSADNFTFKSIIRALMTLDINDFKPFTYGDQTYDADTQIKLILGYSNKLYEYYNTTSNPNQPSYAKLMNMFLTTAQLTRANRVMSSFLSKSFLYRNSSVWDYHDVGDLVFNINRSLFSRAAINNTIESLPTEYILMELCFGRQTPSTDDITEYERRWLKRFILDDDLILSIKPKGSGSGFNDSDVGKKNGNLVGKFFNKLGINFNETNVKMTLPFLRYFIYSYLSNYGVLDVDDLSLFNTVFNIYLRDDLVALIKKAKVGFTAYATGFNNAIIDSRLSETNEQLRNNMNIPLDIKTKAYYDIKAIYDNWILFSADDTKWYNYHQIQDECDSANLVSVLTNATNNQRDLFDYFEFLDRANNDISTETYFDLKWLSEFFGNSPKSVPTQNLEISFYAFIDNIAKHHGFLLHTLPAFTNLGSFTQDEAANLFETFDEVDISDSKPTALFQYAGDVTSTLDLANLRNVQNGSSSFCFDTNSANLPKDILNTQSGTTCFVVDYGATDQQIFKNLELDQSEFQSTAEYFTTITDLASKGSQISGNNLFKIYSKQSYTAKIDAMGNAMLMPLTYFYLRNVPMFNGSYWITNVTHSFTPNNMQTSFQGVRQPMSVLPKKRETILRLNADKIKATIGDIQDIDSINSESVSSSHADLTSSPAISELQANGVITIEHMEKVEEIVEYLNSTYGSVLLRDDLVAVIHSESRWDPKNVNKATNATGLIQWIPSTADDMHKLTTSQIKEMTTLQQLDLVRDYLERWIKRKKFNPKSVVDLYMLIFYPNGFDKTGSYVMGSENSKRYQITKLPNGDLRIITKKSKTVYPNNKYYDKFKNLNYITHANYVAFLNPNFDLDSNGEITKQEFGEYMLNNKIIKDLGGKIIYV